MISHKMFRSGTELCEFVNKEGFNVVSITENSGQYTLFYGVKEKR